MSSVFLTFYLSRDAPRWSATVPRISANLLGNERAGGACVSPRLSAMVLQWPRDVGIKLFEVVFCPTTFRDGFAKLLRLTSKF